MWRWGGRGQKATHESGSKARMGIRSDRVRAGAHLCRPGCGRCGSGGQARGRGGAGNGGSAAAPLHHRRRCSPPRGPRSPTAPALSKRAPPGTEGCLPHRCWGQGWGVRRQGPARFPRGRPARLAAHTSLTLLAHQLSHGPVTTSPGSRLSQELSPDPAERLWFSGIPEGTGRGRVLSDGSANHQSCSGLYPAVSTWGDPGPGGRRTQKPQQAPAPGRGSCSFLSHSPRLAPVGKVAGARREGTAVLGGGLGEALTHGSRLVLAAALGGGHAKAVLGQLARGTPTAGLLAAHRVWLALDPRGQVLAGAGAGLPTGEKILATCTVCSRREAERVGLGGPTLGGGARPQSWVTSPPAMPATC